MASLQQPLPFLFLHCLIVIASSSSNQIPKPYVVYMGSSSSNIANRDDVKAAELAHLQLLSSVIPSEESERISLIHHYKHSFKGFSAMLTEGEASVLSGHEEIVSVFPDPILELHTTRSWDFLEAQAQAAAKHTRRASWSRYKYHNQSSDIIIGVIDTGIWPESQSFKDQGMSEIPSRWKGVCMGAPDFKKSNCNRKLIGARFYSVPLASKKNKTKTFPSPRDSEGHGTHTASTVAGAYVRNASYFGLARGTASGGSPYSRIASYNVCDEDGCSGSAILKAIDDAIQDGVDIISISIGSKNAVEQDYLSDPIGIGSFHAELNGVMAICSAGNNGPNPFTVGNTAPWILTVGASTIDRDFQSTVILGNGKSIKGTSIHLSNHSGSMTFPLEFGKNIAVNSTVLSKARSCSQGTLDPKKAAGKILVCIGSEQIDTREVMLSSVANINADESRGLISKPKGSIMVTDDEQIWPGTATGLYPYVEVGRVAGLQIIKYMNSNKNPTATILPTVTVPRHKPAPVVAYFSSRGPGSLTENILKPDVTGPGVAILAAIVPKSTEVGGIPVGAKPATYGLMSGTSMSCPHVSGVVAIIKSVRRNWSYSMIKSALMTTATVYDNTGEPMTNSSGNYANPHEMGTGEISPLRALNPGLVFETSIEDYLRFLCNFGYQEKIVQSLTDKKFNCPKNSKENLISNINYPSISISKLDRHGAVRTVKRTATNVGSPNATYIISRVNAPSGLSVKVFPQKLVFVEGVKRVSFRVSFSGKQASTGYNFGSIIWSDNRHSVRMVFAVNVE